MTSSEFADSAARSGVAARFPTNHAPRVVIASDKFKGSLTAVGVADHLTVGLLSAQPQAQIDSSPMADGGEGTVDAAIAAGFVPVQCTVRGPIGHPVTARFAVRGDVAVVELAEASGLAHLRREELDALAASSYGTGQLIRSALDHGCRTILLGIGGSAGTDGGVGLLQALGARALNSGGRDLAPGGGPLTELAELDTTGLDGRIARTAFVLASDVDNPLLGPHGAAQIYGPQKGASPEDVDRLEAGLKRLAEVVSPAAASRTGAGAAGGVGYSALTVLGAERRPGIDVVMDLAHLADTINGADLVITGEGSLDEQSMSGKTPAGVARLANRLGVPVIAVCGRSTLDQAAARTLGLARVYSLSEIEPDPERSMNDAGPLLERVGRQIGEEHLHGPSLSR